MRAKLPYLVGGVVALLIALRISIHFATPPPVNPQERIRQMFAEGKQAFEREDVNALMAMVADDFEWGGLNKEQLRYQLANFFKNVQALRAEYTPAPYRSAGRPRRCAHRGARGLERCSTRIAKCGSVGDRVPQGA
jgi:hypothetical protein